MKRTLAAAIVVASLTTLAACDSGTPASTATTPAAAPAAAPPPPPPPPPAASAPAPAAAGMAGLSEPYATEADFVAGCTTLGKIDKTVCDCVGKTTSKELGQKALFQWVWEGYVQNA